MLPTYVDATNTMAWLSLTGLIALAGVAFVIGCLLLVDHFPASRIAKFLYTPKIRIRVSDWRSEDETKAARIDAAFHGVASPIPFDRSNLAASHRGTVTPIASGRRRA